MLFLLRAKRGRKKSGILIQMTGFLHVFLSIREIATEIFSETNVNTVKDFNTSIQVLKLYPDFSIPRAQVISVYLVFSIPRAQVISLYPDFSIPRTQVISLALISVYLEQIISLYTDFSIPRAHVISVYPNFSIPRAQLISVS